jgi:hypothetical protein
MNTKTARKNAAKTSVKAPVSPAVKAVIQEGKDLGHTEPSIVAEAAAVAATEAPAPVAPVAPVATPAPEAKVIWADVMKKAQASFAKTGSFREGTNRAVMYPLLQRPQGMSLAEAVTAVAGAGRVRREATIQTDLHDIASITQRKLIRCDKDGVKRYRLADLAPIAAPEAVEVK